MLLRDNTGRLTTRNDKEGLRARIAYREAAGWLARSHTWVSIRAISRSAMPA